MTGVTIKFHGYIAKLNHKLNNSNKRCEWQWKSLISMFRATGNITKKRYSSCLRHVMSPTPHPLHWYLDSWVMKHQCDACMMLEMAWRTPQLLAVVQSPLTKASDAELWCFIWSAPWINGWVNNRKAGDLRRHCAHYDVILMWDYFYQHSKLIIEVLWKLFLCNSYINDTIRSPHSVKLVSPQSLTDEKVAGPVKNIGGPINLLYKTMSKIGKKL